MQLVQSKDSIVTIPIFAAVMGRRCNEIRFIQKDFDKLLSNSPEYVHQYLLSLCCRFGVQSEHIDKDNDT